MTSPHEHWPRRDHAWFPSWRVNFAESVIASAQAIVMLRAKKTPIAKVARFSGRRRGAMQKAITGLSTSLAVMAMADAVLTCDPPST